jgi:hypothetical protein
LFDNISFSVGRNDKAAASFSPHPKMTQRHVD